MSKRISMLRACALALAMAVAVAAPHFVTAQTPADPGKAVADDYVIGPGDVLRIVVERVPDLSAEVPVRPDGKITTPQVENMVAVGKSPSMLARDMEVVLAEVGVKVPRVTVIVSNAVSTSSQVKVMGQVRVQQAVPYREGLKVSDVILLAGGVTEFASPNKSKIVRTTAGKTIEIKVKLGNLLNKGDVKQDLELKPGDILMVPQSLF